jgi:hypothetical protein
MVTGDPAILLHELMVCKAMVGKTTDCVFFSTLFGSIREPGSFQDLEWREWVGRNECEKSMLDGEFLANMQHDSACTVSGTLNRIAIWEQLFL